MQALRMRILVAVFALAAAGYIGRAAQLQLLQGDRWAAIARAQSAARVEIPARRGGIFDRDGKPLVLDRTEYRAYLAPREIADLRNAVESVDRILGLGSRETNRLLRADSGWEPLPRLVTAVERDRLESAIRQGVHFDIIAARAFPSGDLAADLLGIVGPGGAGISGLEMRFDSLLSGEAGTALHRQDARGERYPLPGAPISEAEPGHDIILTIDAELQAIAERALERALAETGASGGDVLLADPRTGALLAVASRRRDGRGGIAAFTDPYEPGSTLKPFLLATLLAEDRARLSERVYAEDGVWETGGRVIRDVHAYGTLTVAEVVRFSSNIGASKLAGRLEPGTQYRYLRDFGFGTPTGIEYPSESGGLLRRPERWSGFSQASLAMGYEILVTSVQMAAAYGALANGGVLLRPGLVKEVRDASGNTVWRREPVPLRRVVAPEVADKVTGVLASVVRDGGTGTRAALATVPVAGKTGTARIASEGGYRERRYRASFVGYLPVHDPRLVVVAMLVDPQGSYYGGLTAAPLVREVVQAAFAAHGLDLYGPPSRRGGTADDLRWADAESAPRPGKGPYVLALNANSVSGPEGARAPAAGSGPRGARAPDAGSGPPGVAGAAAGGRPDGVRAPAPGAVVLPDLRGLTLRAAVRHLHGLGLHVELSGSGRVAAQEPEAGTRVVAGATVVLR